MLAQGGAEHGNLKTLTRLDPLALRVPRGTVPSWQHVVSSLDVRRPAMVGTAAPPGARASAHPSTIAPASLVNMHITNGTCTALCQLRRPVTLVPLVASSLLVLIALAVLLTRRIIGWRVLHLP